MHDARRSLSLAFIAALGSACALDAAAAPVDINYCTSITTPGSYVVMQNLFAGGDCILVKADDVNLDLNGFSLSGNGTGAGLRAWGAGLTVRNGTITGFGVGIFLSTGAPPDVPGAIIERVRVANSLGFGIGGGAAVVRDSVITGNGNTGIGLGSGSLVTGNRVVGNRAGISVQEGSVVSGNTVAYNKLTGIVATCPALVLGNAAVGNVYMGINANLILTGTNCTVDHNAAP